MSSDILLFDLDDTLYPSTTGLWFAIRERMTTYMLERLGMEPEIVPTLRRRYYETYGTTLRGLQRHHQVDTDDFLAYVHDLPLQDYLEPAPDLRRLLESLPQPKWIFTNADAPHAQRVVDRLGLQGCFQGVIDVRALEFTSKPEANAYRRALEIVGERDPGRCVMLDDSLNNLRSAGKLGFVTVLVGAERPQPEVDYSLPSLFDLPRVMPHLWNGRPAPAGLLREECDEP